MRLCRPFAVVCLLWIASATNAKERQPQPPILKDAFGELLPPGAIARISTPPMRCGEGEEPDLPAISPDGKLMAVLKTHWSIELLNLPKKDQHFLITSKMMDNEDPPIILGCVAFAADGKKLLTLDLHKDQLHLLDVKTGKCLTKVAFYVRDLNLTRDPRFMLSPDEKTVFADIRSQRGREFRTVDWSSGKVTYSSAVPDPRSPQPRIAVSHERGWLAKSTPGSEIRGGFPPIEIFELANPQKSIRKIVTKQFAKQLEFSPNGKWLAAHDGAVLAIYEAESGKGHSRKVGTAPIKCMTFTPDSAALLVVDEIGAVHRWDPASAEMIGSYSVTPITQLGFSPNGELFIASRAGAISWWNPRTGAYLRYVRLDLPPDNDAEPSPFTHVSRHGNFATTYRVGIFDMKDGKKLYPFKADREADTGDTDYFADETKAATLLGNKVLCWNVRTGKDFAKFELPLEPSEQAFGLTVSPGGRYFAFFADKRSLVWDSSMKKVIHECPVLLGDFSLRRPFCNLQFSPDERRFIVDEEGTVLVYSIGDAGIRKCFELPNGTTEAAFSPDGRHVACVHQSYSSEREKLDSALQVYEIATGKLRLERSGLPDVHFHSVSYSPDSALVATAMGNETALVWNAGLRALAGNAGAAPMSKKKLAAAFKDMADPDSKDALQAMIRLVQSPGQTVELLGEKVPPAPLPDLGGKTIGHWIQDLGSAQYAVRTKAVSMLKSIGPLAVPALRSALPNARDLETIRRIGELLEHFDSLTWTPEERMHARAVEVIEAIGTTEARALLTRWSGGNAEAVLTREARKSLARSRP
jgi:WD40 repeat protein